MAGRPSIGERVEVRLPAEVLAAVDARVEQARTERPTASRADIIRDLVTASLEQK